MSQSELRTSPANAKSKNRFQAVENVLNSLNKAVDELSVFADEIGGNPSAISEDAKNIESCSFSSVYESIVPRASRSIERIYEIKETLGKLLIG